MNGAFVVVRPLPAACSARTPAMKTPLLLLISPCGDSRPLCLHLYRVGLACLEPRDLDLLIRDHRALRVEKFENQSERLGYQRLPLRSLAFPTGGGGCDAGAIRRRGELTHLDGRRHAEQFDRGLVG